MKDGKGVLYLDLEAGQAVDIGKVNVHVVEKRLGRKVRLKITADRAIPVSRSDKKERG